MRDGGVGGQRRTAVPSLYLECAVRDGGLRHNGDPRARQDLEFAAACPGADRHLDVVAAKIHHSGVEPAELIVEQPVDCEDP